jgi:DNA helicase-2/ATP-dependent DNA helicase PcrA
MERTRGVSSFFGRESPEVDSDSAAGLQAGRKVRHPTLGLGVVLDSEGEGDGQKLTVFFDRSGKRKLVAKYANLEIVS